MPSVLAVAGAAREGGAEVALLRLLVRLRERGWVATLTTPAPGQLADRARGLGLALGPHLPVGGLEAGAGRGALRAYGPLARLARGFDVVYLNGRPVVGYVGRIEPAKGVLDLARAAPALRDAGARVVVVGDDTNATDAVYRAAVTGAPGVEAVGWVPDAAGLMPHLDVLVLPSRREALGGTLAEAIAAGTPVVATDTGGIGEVVEDGVTGRLVAPGDPSALAAAILDVLARRDEMAAACRARAGRWDAEAYADLVARLVAP